MQGRLGIKPDLTTLGKIIGGGLPVGAFGGRADVMAGFDPTGPEPIHHSGTFAGNAATMAAGLATLNAYGPDVIDELNALGDRLRSGLQDAFSGRRTRGQITGVGSLIGVHFADQPVRDYRSGLKADRNIATAAHLALLNRGIVSRPGGGFFLSTPMTDKEV